MRLRLEETLQSWRRCGVSTLVTGKQGLRPSPMVPQGWGASTPLTLCVKPAYASKALWHPVVGLGLNGAPWLHPGRLLLGMPMICSMLMPRALFGVPETRLSGSVGVPGTLPAVLLFAPDTGLRRCLQWPATRWPQTLTPG